MYFLHAKKFLCPALILLTAMLANAQPPEFSQVVPQRPLSFPQDRGAHPDFRTEWWYVTGWLQTPDKKPLGFQVTFFRSATDHDRTNPSGFAPTQLIIAHAALSDPSIGKLQHDQKIARAGMGLAEAKTGDTNIKLHNWRMQRAADGRYQITMPARDFALTLTLTPTQPLLLQGEQGYSRKGSKPQQASYYYSEPHLQVSGTVQRAGKTVAVSGEAWLDHEWSSSVLATDAAGWDWVGANLDDGAALMAFRIRGKNGSTLWQHATLRESNGKTTQYQDKDIRFLPQRTWRSPRTGATYPVEMVIEIGMGEANKTAADITRWQLQPLQDDQELDSRTSTGAVYWEGAVSIQRNNKPAGRGYFEMTGYDKPLKL
jgi:predicted secreted hydrolase